MNSSWDQTRAQSNYHFDPKKQDSKDDVITALGHITPTWSADLDNIISTARPAQWANRGYKGEGVEVPPEDLAAEEYDIARVGADPRQTITHLNWQLPESLQTVADAFALADSMARIHVQRPGELWHRHIDKLQKWSPEDPTQVLRVFVQLTDWQPGQFWEYGNYHWNQWLAGDVSTFDWANMPHATANAGHAPRVTLQLTGVITERTRQYLRTLR
jgi:hypothetical protein